MNQANSFISGLTSRWLSIVEPAGEFRRGPSHTSSLAKMVYTSCVQRPLQVIHHGFKMHGKWLAYDMLLTVGLLGTSALAARQAYRSNDNWKKAGWTVLSVTTGTIGVLNAYATWSKILDNAHEKHRIGFLSLCSPKPFCLDADDKLIQHMCPTYDEKGNRIIDHDMARLANAVLVPSKCNAFGEDCETLRGFTKGEYLDQSCLSEKSKPSFVGVYPIVDDIRLVASKATEETVDDRLQAFMQAFNLPVSKWTAKKFLGLA